MHRIQHVLGPLARRLKRVSDAKTSTFFAEKVGELALSLFVPSSAPNKMISAIFVVFEVVYVRPTSRTSLKVVGAQNC